MTPFDAVRWKELSAYLDLALEMSAHERGGWLDDLRTRDSRLADDLAALLAAHVEATERGFLKGTLPWPLADVTLRGRTVGAYTLDAPIGHGGMGSVWRAHRSDERFEGVVAVKLLNLALLGSKGVQRFRREASILARLSHPNIARLLDAGITDEGQPYLVLEYVAGERVDEYCDARRLTIDARLRLFLDVLAAVESAHGSLVVHRDLKPSNLLVGRDGTVKLLDFGIAKLIADRPQATQEDTRLLTPEFAAPEQFTSAPVTIATDVYALGVLLHVLLCGAHPCGAGSPADRVKALIDGETTRLAAQTLSSRSAQQRATTIDRLRRRLAGDLDNIVARAMKVAPHERYESVARFAEDLRRHLSHEPISARADTLVYRAGKFVRKHRVGVATAAATLCALLAATAITTWQMLEARAQRDEALYQTRRAQAVNDFMREIMAQPGPATPLELLDRGRTMLEKQYAADPAFVVGMLIGIAGRYMDVARIDKELETLEQAELIARATGDDELVANVQCNTVDTEVRLGHNEGAAVRMEEARRALAGLRHVRIGLRVACLNAETYVARSRGDIDGAIGFSREALALLERNGIENLDYTMILSALSALYAQQDMFREAHALTMRIRESDERTGRGGSIGALIAVHNEASDFVAFGDILKAEQLERHVIERLVQEANAADAIAPEFASLYGEIECLLDRSDQGLPWLRFAVWRAQVAGDSPVEARAKLRLARVLIDADDVDEAQPLLDAAARTLGGERGGRSTAEIARLRAMLLLGQDRVDDARRAIEALMTDLTEARSTAPARMLRPLLSAARVQLRAGDAAKAEAYANAALSAAQSTALDSSRSLDVGRAWLLIGQARRAKGDQAGARDAFEQARAPIASSVGADHPLAREIAARQAKVG